MDSKDIKKKKITYMIIGIAVMFISIAGATFCFVSPDSSSYCGT